MEKQKLYFTPGQHLESIVNIAIALIEHTPATDWGKDAIDSAVEKSKQIVDDFIQHMTEHYAYPRYNASGNNKKPKEGTKPK